MIDSEEFQPETTTLWDFPKRGAWAAHRADYRGNFAPQVPRNLMLAYSREGDFVLDPMVGSGTTLIEARLLHRNALGLDVNPHAVEITQKRLAFAWETEATQTVKVADARTLDFVANDSVDLIVTHPPYYNIIKYSEGNDPDDLSSLTTIRAFLIELNRVVHELYRVLKPDHYCAILMGDTRKAKHYIPLSYFLLQMALQRGFVLKEQIIKAQRNTTYAKQWAAPARKFGFYLIMHEHLFVFRKPRYNEDTSAIRYSMWLGGLERNNTDKAL